MKTLAMSTPSNNTSSSFRARKPLDILYSAVTSVPAPLAPTPLKPRYSPVLPRLRRNWAEDLTPLRTRPNTWAMLGEFLKGTAGSLRKNKKLRQFHFYERCFPSKREAQLWARYDGKRAGTLVS